MKSKTTEMKNTESKQLQSASERESNESLTLDNMKISREQNYERKVS